jgi:putative membrane protein
MAMMYWGDHMSTGGWIFSILATLIFLALIGALIFWLLSATTSGGSLRGDSRESPKEVLDRRLASGELTIEQYQQLRDALTRGQLSSPPASHGPQAPPSGAAGAVSGGATSG